MKEQKPKSQPETARPLDRGLDGLGELPRVTQQAMQKQQSAVEAAQRILALTNEDLTREGLRDTPQRFARAYASLFRGYDESLEAMVGKGIFPSEGQGLIAVENIEFYSLCEHHLLPFWGKATVAYFPRDKILGLSKFSRIVDLYARRVQVQERITQEVLDAVRELIQPRAILVSLHAQHLCMMMRGVEKQQSMTATQAIYGYDELQSFEQQQLLQLIK